MNDIFFFWSDSLVWLLDLLSIGPLQGSMDHQITQCNVLGSDLKKILKFLDDLWVRTKGWEASIVAAESYVHSTHFFGSDFSLVVVITDTQYIRNFASKWNNYIQFSIFVFYYQLRYLITTLKNIALYNEYVHCTVYTTNYLMGNTSHDEGTFYWTLYNFRPRSIQTQKPNLIGWGILFS